MKLDIHKGNIIIALLLVVIICMGIYFVTLKKNPEVAGESLFDKREHCANNRQNAQDQLENNYKLATPYFYDIFYSPKTGTCVYTYGLLLLGKSPNEVGSFVIADYFTGESLVSFQYDNSTEDESKYSYSVRPKFDDAVMLYRK
jgi:hypothetical protein